MTGVQTCALPISAFWVGLLYDTTALDAAWDLVKDWTIAEMHALRDETPRLGLQTPFRGGTLQPIAQRVVAIAVEGLRGRRRTNRMGDSDETHFLNPLVEIAASGRTPADLLLDRYRNAWGGRIDPIYDEEAY